MITRELLNKLGKAKAEEYSREIANNAMHAVAGFLGESADMEALDCQRISNEGNYNSGYIAGFTSALDLLFPGVEAAEDTKNIKSHDHLNWAQKMAREFLAKLERELEGK